MYQPRLKPIPKSAPYRAPLGSLFVYAIQAERFFKIGRTHDIEGRYLAIASACPLPLVLRWRLELPKDIAERVEIEMHMALREYRVRREWFELGSEMVREAYTTAQRRAFWTTRPMLEPIPSNTIWLPTQKSGNRLRHVPQELSPDLQALQFPPRSNKMM